MRQYTDSVSSDSTIIDYVTAMQVRTRGAWVIGGPCSAPVRLPHAATRLVSMAPRLPLAVWLHLDTRDADAVRGLVAAR